MKYDLEIHALPYLDIRGIGNWASIPKVMESCC